MIIAKAVVKFKVINFFFGLKSFTTVIGMLGWLFKEKLAEKPVYSLNLVEKCFGPLSSSRRAHSRYF